MYFALRRAGRASANGVLTTDLLRYHRALPVPVPPLRYGEGTPLVFLVRHNPQRCAPFGVFDVYAAACGQPRAHVGSQLSCPSHDDCRRLLRQACARAHVATAASPHTTRSR